MRVNLLKRMESSIYSFAITAKGLLDVVNAILEKIQMYEDKLDRGMFDSAELNTFDETDKVYLEKISKIM